jgi:hypothetical protein
MNWKTIGFIAIVAILAVMGYNKFVAPKTGVSA